MRIVFFGTGKFSETILRGLIDMGQSVVAVVTQPDKVNGRNGKINFSEIKTACLDLGVPVYQFNSVSKEGEEVLKSYAPDLFVTASYGQIIRQNILDIPKFCTINVHASLLPKYRGSSPIQWAILNGETKTGITIMETVLKVDAGDIFLQREIDIEDEDTTSSVFNKLSTLGVECLKEFFANFDYYISHKIKQDESKMTYYPMLKKEDYLINFNKTSREIVNHIRALEGSYFIYHGARYKIFKAKNLDNLDMNEFIEVKNKKNEVQTGIVLKADSKNGLIISTLDGAVKIETIQPEGKSKMPASAYMNSNKFKVGDRIENS